MFEITPTKTFKDSVHGYINIPVCFVHEIIDTELFQRLRNIDQTGMKVLYANAKHDRFAHSLGVYHLGSKAVEALLTNFSSNAYWKISSDNNRVLFWAKNKLLFLLACLLHDIGHVPFSHSLENIVIENSRIDGKTLTQVLIERINCIEKAGEKVTDLGKAAAHEKMGALLILESLRENINRIYLYLKEKNFPQEKSRNILYAEHYQDNVVLNLDDIDNDICFIVRMILGLKYQGYEPEKQIRNCFIELLNGDNFDVDKLDYIVRDTKMSGISNIDIDIERLLGAVCIVSKTVFIDKEFNNEHFRGNTIHRLSNRDNPNNSVQLKGRFSGTLLLGQGAEVSIAGGSTIALMKGSLEDTTIQYCNSGSTVKFNTESVVYQDGELLRSVDNKSITLSDTKNTMPFLITIKDAYITEKQCFHFRVCGRGNIMLKINGGCDITMKGKCTAEAEISYYDHILINGTVHEIEFLKDEIADALPSSNAFTAFTVGFNKQALSTIANVLEARNYLYLWIYAHHKVIYYANFLIPAISDYLLSSKKQKNPLKWKLTYKDIEYLDDAYVWTILKYHYYINKSCPDSVKELCAELFSRKYKKSLFKSLAEYDLLFDDFSDEQKRVLKRTLGEAVDKTNICVMEDGVVTAGFLRNDVVKELKAQNGMEKISSIVYVDASYKRKRLNTYETFIMLHGEAISVDKVSLLADKWHLADRDRSVYFYLYYSSDSKTLKEQKQEKDAIKAAIKNMSTKTLCAPSDAT